MKDMRLVVLSKSLASDFGFETFDFVIALQFKFSNIRRCS